MSSNNAIAGPSNAASLYDGPYPKRSLKKNQACLQCRKGKMKCDAAQPQCTNCVRAWQLLQETPELAPNGMLNTRVYGFFSLYVSRPPEAPECQYDPVEGLIFVPDTITDPLIRTRVIEDQLAQLQAKLQEARDDERRLSKGKRPSSSSGPPNPKKRKSTVMDPNDESGSSMPAKKRSRGASGTTGAFAIHNPVSTASILGGGMCAISAEPDGETEVLRRQSEISKRLREGVQGWTKLDVPHQQLMALLEAFITNDSHSSRIFHLPSLRASFRFLNNTSPSTSSRIPLPSQALVHAICAVAARYMSGSLTPSSSTSPTSASANKPSRTPTTDVDPLFASFPSMKAFLNLHASLPNNGPSRGSSGSGSGASTPGATGSSQPAPEWRAFASQHATRARELINQALALHQSQHDTTQPFVPVYPVHQPTLEEKEREDSLFKDVLQPLIVLTTYYYHEARAIELWANIGALARNVIALRLDLPNRQPVSSILEEEKRRALWSTFVLDRLVSVGGAAHCLAEEDTFGRPDWAKLEPLSRTAFNGLRNADSSTAGDSTPSDSYSLLMDATLMLGRVTEFRSRPQLQRRPHRSSSMSTTLNSFSPTTHSTLAATMDINTRWELLRLCTALVDGIGVGVRKSGGTVPARFRQPIGVVDLEDEGVVEAAGVNVDRRQSKGRLDTDLFLAHMVHHATIILLSFSVASFGGDPRDPMMTCSIPQSSDALLSQFLLAHTTNPISLTLPINGTALGAVRRHSVSSSDQHHALSAPPTSHGPPPTSLSTINTNVQTHASRPVPYNPAIPPGMFHSMPASPTSASPINLGFGFGLDGTGLGLAPTTTTVVETGGASVCNLEKATDTCVAAARSVVDALTLIRATSFDITRLHPFVCTCWYLAAVVLLHEHQRCTQQGDIMKKGITAREVQMLRLALLKYGARSPIGNHHERQLTALLDKIMNVPSVDLALGATGRRDTFNELLLGGPTSITPSTFQLPYIPVFPFDPASLTRDRPYQTTAPLPDVTCNL